MNKGILSRQVLDLVTLTSARNIQRVENTFDISDAKSFESKDVTLPANNQDLDNPDSDFVIMNIEKFLHIQVSRTANISLNNSTGSITLVVDRILNIVAAFDSVIITNTNTDQAKSLFIKAIYA